MEKKKKIVVAITGASGSIYARLLFEALKKAEDQIACVNVVLSKTATSVWEHELGTNPHSEIPFKIFEPTDFWAPFASGSAGYDTMIVCPCSMGTLGRIASGISDDLITRAADVMLKERQKLILVTREMPLNLIHIRNMKIVTETGAIICPASPSFYSKPETIEQACQTVIERIVKLAGIDLESYKWSE